MKKVLRVLVLGLMAMLAATAVFAQERDRAKFMRLRKELSSHYYRMQTKGFGCGKEYIEKFNTADESTG